MNYMKENTEEHGLVKISTDLLQVEVSVMVFL